MSDGFSADTAQLLSQASQFPDLAQQASTVRGELDSALADTGACWGDDAVGRSFAQSYLPPAETTLARFAALPGQLRDVGEKFTATANAYRAVDENTARALT